jgi:hypothetical protein
VHSLLVELCPDTIVFDWFRYVLKSKDGKLFWAIEETGTSRWKRAMIISKISDLAEKH